MKTLKRVYAGLIFIFLYSPIVILIVFSFNDSKSRAVWNGFTFRWYAELFRDRQILTAFFYTITVAVLSSFFATLIGTLAAIGIDSSRRRLKSLYTNITYLPILNPEIVTGISLMLLFIFFKMRLGFLSLLLAHTAVNTSYVIFSVLPRLRLLDKHLYEAALDLGARPIFAYRKVILPELLPGIASGALLAFTLSLDDFIISFFTTGSGVSNLSIMIYSMARRGINPKINALSTLLFITVLALLFAVDRAMTKQEKQGGTVS